MSLAKNVGKVIGAGMKVSAKADSVVTKAGQYGYMAGKKSTNALGKVARGAGKSVTSTGGFVLNQSSQALNKTLDGAEFVGSKAANSKLGQKLKLKEHASPITDRIDKKTGEVVKKWDNLWTGKKISNSYAGVGAVGIAAIGAAAYETEKNLYPITISRKNVEQGGAPEIMQYDGVGQQSAPRNLNANGDIVFGLHNSRRG